MAKWTENYSKFDALDSDDSDDEKNKKDAKKNASDVLMGEEGVSEKKTTVSLDGSPVLHPTSIYQFENDIEFNSNKSRIKSLPQNIHEVWQVTCYKLKCWTSLASSDDESQPDHEDSVIVRPWCVLVACIYPEEGRLLGYDVNASKPHVFPSAASAAHCLLKLMMDPPFGNQRRPVGTLNTYIPFIHV